MLRRRWDQFMCPNGIRRTFNPKKWEHGTPVLVFGELLALCSAVAAIPDWAHSRWFLYAAPIIAAGALAWYALDKSSLGEMPLTGVSANRIANVVHLMKAEETLGPVVHWDTITADGTSARMDISQIKPEIKRRIVKHEFQQQWADIGPEAATLIEGLLSDESQVDMALGRMMSPDMRVNVPADATDETDR